MKIKVCGMKHPENIEALTELSPDYIGFIFYGKSPRYLNALSTDILQTLPASVIKTGVFVNEAIEVINQIISQYSLSAVQLHGSESAAFCELLQGKVTVFKAFGIEEKFNFDLLDSYAQSVDCFLFDTKTEAHGGSGKTFDWDVLNNYKLNVPFLLSGGLSLDNLEKVKQIKHPAFYGVDLNSRFEIEPGLKDINKLREAFKILRD
jgi:phosphoribosylanthranilate isomerase